MSGILFLRFHKDPPAPAHPYSGRGFFDLGR